MIKLFDENLEYKIVEVDDETYVDHRTAIGATVLKYIELGYQPIGIHIYSEDDTTYYRIAMARLKGFVPPDKLLA